MNFALTEEQLMVRDMVRKFAETEIKPVAAELDQTHRHPEEICRKLGEMGIMGVSVPTEYGGAGMDNVTYVLAMIEISKACASCGVIVSVNNTLYGHPVKTFGTHEQKLKFLKPLQAARWKAATPLPRRVPVPMRRRFAARRAKRRQIHRQRDQSFHHQRSGGPLLCFGGDDGFVAGL